jgi:hypothetical protein
MTKEMKANQIDSINALRNILPTAGMNVYTKVNSVSRSGMSRRISLYVVVDGEIRDITWHVARAFGESTKQRGEYVQDAGLHVGGCGMDMCFATVYNLGRVLFPDGFAVEGRGRNGDGSGWDNDGGYALNKRDL